MSTIKDLIDAIADGNTLDIESNFNSVVSQKIADRLEDMRQDVASRMFSEDVINEKRVSKKLERLENTRQQRKVHDDHVLARREKYYNFNESTEDLDEANYAKGEWHVTDELHGGIHSTHPTPRKAKNLADKLNQKDYDDNKDDESRRSGNIFHSRYGTKAKSSCNESELDEACQGCDGEYHKNNPKIDLYHKDSGKYLASTNHSTTVKHAVAGYEKAYPEHAGKIKGSIDRR